MKIHDSERLLSQLIVWAIRAIVLALLAAAILSWKVFDLSPFMFEVLAVFAVALYPVHYCVKKERFVWGLMVLLLVGTGSLVGSLNLTGREIGFVNFMFLLYSVLASTMFLPEIAKRSRSISPLPNTASETTRTPVLD